MKHLPFYRAEIDISGFNENTPVTGSGYAGLTVKDVLPIDQCSLTPGDPSPVGRCPHSEDLVYLDRPKDRQHDAGPRYHDIAGDALEILQIVLEDRERVQGEEDEVLRDLIARIREVHDTVEPRHEKA